MKWDIDREAMQSAWWNPVYMEYAKVMALRAIAEQLEKLNEQFTATQRKGKSDAPRHD